MLSNLAAMVPINDIHSQTTAGIVISKIVVTSILLSSNATAHRHKVFVSSALSLLLPIGKESLLGFLWIQYALYSSFT